MTMVKMAALFRKLKLNPLNDDADNDDNDADYHLKSFRFRDKVLDRRSLRN